MVRQTKETMVAEKNLKNEAGEEFKVKYFRLEAEAIGEEGNYLAYGVGIRKFVKEELVEKIEIYLSESLNQANSIIELLASNQVTPVSAAEVIDDIYSSY